MTASVATVDSTASSPVRRVSRLVVPKSDRARLTTDTAFSFGWKNVVVASPDWESTWRDFDLDRKTLDTISPANLVEIMSNLSPELSRAIWDFTTNFNPGLSIRAYELGTDDTEHAAGQQALDDFLAVLDERHGDFDVIIERLVLAAYLRGAFFAELVLDASGTQPIDLVTPDPLSVTFKKIDDGPYGERWQLGQYQQHEWVALDKPTVRYFPVHAKPGSPYGRSPATPALFPALFILMMFHDLRRVVAQAGYPRIDVSIDVEAIRMANPDVADADEFNELVNGVVDDVIDAIEDLEPDDVYVHPSFVSVNLSQGAVDSKALDGAGPIIDALQREAMFALKLTPLMMGQTAGISEANANRQWEMWVRSIKSLQERCAELLESLFTIALRVQGIQAKVVVQFDEMRRSEQLRDEQALQLAMTNADLGRMLGFYDDEEASEHAVGHPPKGPRREPEAQTDGQKVDPLDPNASIDGEELADDTFRGEGRLRREKLVPAGGVDDLDAVPTSVAIDDELIRNGIAQFETWLPEYAGLLDAALAGD